VTRGALARLVAAVVLALVPAECALAAANAVPGTTATRYQVAITADASKPAACASTTLTTVVAGVNGTNAADLLLGGAGNDTMNAGNGTDCVLGGGGADAINGGNGNDVCIGGPGTDTFTNCETQIQ
jgi:Ca2+-binding RTX toxin-like protein